MRESKPGASERIQIERGVRGWEKNERRGVRAREGARSEEEDQERHIIKMTGFYRKREAGGREAKLGS